MCKHTFTHAHPYVYKYTYVHIHACMHVPKNIYTYIFITACGPLKHQRVISGSRNEVFRTSKRSLLQRGYKLNYFSLLIHLS